MHSIDTIRNEIFFFRELCDARAERAFGIQRMELPLSVVDLMLLFRNGAGYERIYWCNRDGSESVAGFGVADMVESHGGSSLSDLLNTVHSRLAFADDNVRFYGGCRFDTASGVSDEWSEFGSGIFAVPMIEIIKRHDSYFIAYNYTLGGSEYLESLMDSIFSDLSTEDRVFENQVISEKSYSEKEIWCDNVHSIISAFNSNLTKVVPARKSLLKTKNSIDTVSLAEALFDHNHSTYNFYFEFDQGTAFIGASPECLFKRDQSDLYCEAIAGTSDGVTQDKLDSSAKNQMEHAIVHKQLIDDLNKLCSEVSVAQECQMLELRELTHLMSSFTGTLCPDISDADIMSQLHPTAAVCGESREQAMNMIRELEIFDRGWYSAPVGWISKGESKFAVAIRSALISGNTASLYAGAGIVRGSEPELEWEETTRKMEQFLKLISPTTY